MNVVLIGPRGVGKSKVSRKLSKLTGMAYVITDMAAVYESGGISIPEMVKKDGGDWRDFRRLEVAILQKLQKAENLILDCGGGILFDVDEKGEEFFSEEKFNLLQNIGTVIFLSQDTEYLIDKVKNDPSRPDLSALKSYREILERRLPYYRKAASFTLQIDNKKITEVAKMVIKHLGLRTY
ncbi:MAG: shikimate kinase [Leptospiraceae bacterium]|nr:shikimate kinase [Leptospiraceae bacterium]MCP5502545.1 shikimate kinase [Leptospiraceae bacterium]